MRVLVTDILRKIPDLPPGFEDLVQIGEKGLAEVRSFQDTLGGEEWHTVHLEPHRADPGDRSVLNGTCACPARTACHHMTAFYAVAKKDDPAVIEAMAKRDQPKAETKPAPPTSKKADGLALIVKAQEGFSEAIQNLVDGLGLLH